MPKKKKKATLQTRHTASAKKHSNFITNTAGNSKEANDAASLPVFRAYVPIKDCWDATGLGTAGIVRQHPDGKLSYAFFVIKLLEDGIESAFGKIQEEAEDMESHLNEVSHLMPPMEEGPLELASEFIWGAYALGDSRGIVWPHEMKRHLKFVPQPPGTKKMWKKRFCGPKGLTPTALYKISRDIVSIVSNLPDGKEVAIFTTATFSLSDREFAVNQLKSRQNEFFCSSDTEGVTSFDWSQDPDSSVQHKFNHNGSVIIEHKDLIINVRSLSMGARLIQILKEILREKIKLKDTVWKKPMGLFR